MTREREIKLLQEALERSVSEKATELWQAVTDNPDSNLFEYDNACAINSQIGLDLEEMEGLSEELTHLEGSECMLVGNTGGTNDTTA